MDPRFLKEEGPEVFSGNELLLKGALEAGCSLITGYPGSPISELFDAAFANRDLLRSLGIWAEMANNEALAVARLNGARMAGARALAAMKSVGLHVAADGLALGNLAEPDNAGGCVVVVGDDPWMESTQINNDSFRKFTEIRSTPAPAIRAMPCLIAFSTKGCKSRLGTR